MRDPTKSVRRYVLGILACQAILVLAWINLGPDASATGYSSVQSLLDSIGDSQPQERAYMLLASSAIRRSSRNVQTLGTIVLVTSLIVMVLSVMIGIQMRRKAHKPDGD